VASQGWWWGFLAPLLKAGGEIGFFEGFDAVVIHAAG